MKNDAIEQLKISLVQSNLAWEDPEANIAHFKAFLAPLTDTHLIVLPEMFATGFSMNPAKFAASSYVMGVDFLKELAQNKGVIATGSLMAEEDGLYYNRLVWVDPNGQVLTYNKRHLFTMGDESNHYAPGHERVIFEIHGWRVRPLICYDLRFPVWSRNTPDHPYDVLLYTANWPQKRISQWSKLIPARAIENSAYTLGVNRVGVDGNGFAYDGRSIFSDFLGNTEELEPGKDLVHTFTLNRQPLIDFRKSFPVAKDADGFTLLVP